MTSSMLTGERRWASSRRGGMTVLGKVAVPKPINLPSQRLENHGLDPNVEIVPKGTLSWGSRSSSSSTNAWGSSSVSPNTDGTSSPSHLSARPSSGGSGTRPSTAGSDRALEPTPNAWGSTSRPSSASGALASNQTSLTSMRPRSAETRPGSSQLSRFAEPMAENSVAWTAARTAEKLGATQVKNDEFSLSSGDFPSLGFEKDKSVKNSELQDHSSHSRPGSSSGVGKEKTEASLVDDAPVNANVKDGAVNSWRRDCPVYSEDGERPSIEKWQGNPQPYPNAGVPLPHYDAWHGPPVNNPQGGVWFRGPPGGPPFGNPVAPGGFPMEPFSYYRPHIPPPALGNPPAVTPPASGPRAHHPKNGDVYRPHMPDAYIRPGMPIRPGFYPGPMAYEGYYGPPMGFCNSNEPDVPFMGMAAGPPIYNRYTNQNPTEHGNSHGRTGGYGSAAKPLASELVESSHSSDSSRPYRVLLKQHNEWDGKNEPSNLEDSGTITESFSDGKDQPGMPTYEDRQRSDYRKNQDMDLRASACGEKACSQTPENQGSSSSVIVNAKSPESTGNIRTSNDISARKLDGAASDVQVPSRPSVPKDSSLIQKIECLNAKARDNSSAKNRDEQRKKFHSSSVPVNPVKNEVSTGASSLFPERNNTMEVINHFPRELVASGGEKKVESLSSSGAPTSRRTAHGMQGRADRNTGRSNAQDTDGWRKKSVVADTSILSSAQMEATSVQVGDHHISVGTYDRSGSYKLARYDGESVQTISNPIDCQAQHAEMKELAKRQTKQNREEQEEQTRKQKAEAVQVHGNVVPKQKRMGYKQRQNVQAEKTSHEKLVPTPTTPKVEDDTSIDVTVSSGNVTNEIGSTCLPGLAMNSNSVAESSAIQKKKNNRYGKSKQKVEETSSLPAITKEGNFSKSSAESDMPKTSEFELDQDSVQPAFISKDPNQYSEQCRNLPNEECHGRNSQWKSQHSRRMPRNIQVNRPVEKSHGSDAVMWAPVKPQNKTEIMDELTDSNKIEAVNFVKSDQQVHSNLKNKRAEMERYVPKPVAKEMAQHGSVQQVSSSSNQGATDETAVGGDSGSHVAHVTRHTNSAVAKVGSGMEYKNGDGRQSKQGKVHGSWRQRCSTESTTNVHDMHEALNHDSDSYQSVQGSTEHQQAQKSELSSVKGSAKHVDDSSYADGPNNSGSHDSVAMVSTTVTRDQTSGRGSRVPLRGNKNNDFDHKRETEKIEKQVSSAEPSQKDAGAAFKENRGAGERFTSHWQPKSQPSNNHQRGNRSNEQNVGPEVVRVNKNDSATPGGVSLTTGSDNETNDHVVVPPPRDQSMSGKTKAEPGPHSGNQEAKRERRNAPPKGRPQSANQIPFGSVEHDSSSVDTRHEQRPSCGFRKNGNQNRFGRGHESRDWKTPGQDNRQYHQLGNREKQGQNMHYEYYPVGPYDSSEVTSSERPKDDNHSGPGFRERGQTHSRRGGGNFHGRRGGSLD